LGGVARRATYIKRYREVFPNSPLLLVDTGNFSNGFSEVGRIKTRYLLETMALLGTEVANVGINEVNLGYSYFEKLLSLSKFPLISCNHLFAESYQPIATPYLIKRVRIPSEEAPRELKVGLVGASLRIRKRGAVPLSSEEILTLDPVETLKKVAPVVREKCHLLIALLALKPQQAQYIAQQIEGLDIIIAGFSYDTRAFTVGKTIIVYGGGRGKHIGELRLFLDGKNKISNFDNSLILLDDRIPEDDEMVRLVKKSQQEVRERRPPSPR